MTIFSDAVVQTSIGDLLKATLNTEDSLERWLSQPPLFTVLRVNTLKCKIDEARIIIEQHLHQVKNLI